MAKTLTKAAAFTPAGNEGEIVKVRGPEDGRWRAGIRFGPIEVEIDLSTVSAEQFAEIEGDAYLSVRRVEAPAA